MCNFFHSVTASQIIWGQTCVTYQVRDIDTCTGVLCPGGRRGSRKWGGTAVRRSFQSSPLNSTPNFQPHFIMSCLVLLPTSKMCVIDLFFFRKMQLFPISSEIDRYLIFWWWLGGENVSPESLIGPRKTFENCCQLIWLFLRVIQKDDYLFVLAPGTHHQANAHISHFL